MSMDAPAAEQVALVAVASAVIAPTPTRRRPTPPGLPPT